MSVDVAADVQVPLPRHVGADVGWSSTDIDTNVQESPEV